MDTLDCVPVEKIREKALREILSFVQRAASPSNVGVQRVPIPTAELFEGGLSRSRSHVLCPENNAPLGRRESLNRILFHFLRNVFELAR